MNRMHLVPLVLAGLVGATGLAGAVILAVTLGDGAGHYSGAPTPERLVGTWSTSRVSTISYQNRVTGSFAPTSGHIFSYTIAPNGTYELSGLLQSSLYNCTISVFKWERGVLAVAGDRLTLTPREGKVTSKDTCRASSEKEREAVDAPSTYSFRIELRDGKDVLVMKKASGEDWGAFYRK